jgi:hypothetical protein
MVIVIEIEKNGSSRKRSCRKKEKLADGLSEFRKKERLMKIT